MKLEVGMYVRLQNDVEHTVIINKIAHVFETAILTENDGSIYQGVYTKENVIKASYNIIDILEVGDYVNGLPIQKINKYLFTNEKYLNLLGSCSDWENEDIKSVITHEQMKQMAYKVGD